MENVEAPDTLRETLEKAVEAAPEIQEPRQSTIAAAPTAEETAAKEQRARDEAGRFAKGEKAEAKPATTEATQQPAVTPAPVKPRPSSWKKDFDSHWEKFDPTVQDYILQREREYANGVSTYKSEADNARQLNEVIAPFMPIMQQNNVQPAQLIGNLLSAHQRLALGTPQDKTQMFAQLMSQYGVDPQHLFQTLSGQQPQFQQQQYQPSQPQDIERIVESKLVQKEVNNEYQRFIAEAPEKYPHFEAVKETMAGLLQAELAQDYKSAYEAAIRHPRHADIFEAIQKQEREQSEADAKAKAAATVNSARARTVSPKSSTHSGQQGTVKANTSLRGALMEAFESVQTSRV